MFSGGALERASIFALGIVPYISASIIMQLLSVINPTLAEIKKEGEEGRKRINQYTRYATLGLATVQAIGIAKGLPLMIPNLVPAELLGFSFYFVAVVSIVTGTMFLMWLGEQITERGIGNGISILIFTGIVAGMPSAIGQTFQQVSEGTIPSIYLLFIFLIVAVVTYAVVFMERGQRRIVVNYAKRQQGRRMYAAQSSHLPLKINMAGVIPAIFASSLILFPSTLAQWFGESNSMGFLKDLAIALEPGQPLYVALYSGAIIFFCFFYTSIIFNPKETADNLKKSGAFITGIRPGEQTARHIDKVMSRLTMSGALYITAVCLIPLFMTQFMNVQFYFGGTSLLIIVVVIMDFMSQIQTYIMSNKYGDILKKANLKGL